MADPVPPSPTVDPDAIIDAMAPLLGIPVNPAFRPGIAQNLAVMARLAGVMLETPMDEREEPAAVFRP